MQDHIETQKDENSNTEKNDIPNITGLPPATLNTLQKLAESLNNNPEFLNYVNQQLIF